MFTMAKDVRGLDTKLDENLLASKLASAFLVRGTETPGILFHTSVQTLSSQ